MYASNPLSDLQLAQTSPNNNYGQINGMGSNSMNQPLQMQMQSQMAKNNMIRNSQMNGQYQTQKYMDNNANVMSRKDQMMQVQKKFDIFDFTTTKKLVIPNISNMIVSYLFPKKTEKEILDDKLHDEVNTLINKRLNHEMIHR